MFTIFRNGAASGDLPPARNFAFASVRCHLLRAGGFAAVFACSWVAGPRGASAAGKVPVEEVRLDFIVADDGFTRDTVKTLARGESAHPAAPAPSPAASAAPPIAPVAPPAAPVAPPVIPAATPTIAATPPPLPTPSPATSANAPVAPVAAPALPATTPVVESDSPPRRSHLQASTRHHHRVRHHLLAAQSPPPAAVKAQNERRNPLVRFVWWWNGWVIKTFHTKIGTVALGSVGAES